MQLPVNDSTFWIGYWASNIGGAVIAITGWKFTRIARFLLASLFAWACWFNLDTVAETPDAYVDYAWLTPFSWYSEFMNGYFAANVTEIVTAVSIAQGLLALGFLLGRLYARIAAIGTIIFLMVVLPLGIGSAFPAPILMAIGAYFVFRNTENGGREAETGGRKAETGKRRSANS